MIAVGYSLIFIYIFFLIFIIGPIIKRISNIETSRKIIHIMLFVVWILIDIFMKNTIHQVIVPATFLILNCLSYKFKIYKSIERESSNHLGTIYFAISIMVIMFLALVFPKLYYCSGIATFCLTFGDGFAALIGYNTKSYKIKNNKTINGFISCFIFSSLSLLLFQYLYNIKFGILSCFLVGLSVAIFELADKGLDNFSVVFISFLLSYLFICYPSSNLTISIVLSEIIFLIVFITKSINYYGSLLSMFIVFSYMYFGGTLGISILLFEYFFIFFVAVIKKGLKKGKKEKGRTFAQIIINGGLGTLFVLLYGIIKDINLLIISIIAISGCFIDSVSSDVGTLSKGKPYDIFKRKRVDNGLSGGMSLLGTNCAAICSLIISLFTTKYLNLNIINSITIFTLIFLQTIIDSFLGSIFQVKYQCKICKKVTEKEVCCDRKTKKISGVSWINNNFVNALTSIIITTTSLIIYLV